MSNVVTIDPQAELASTKGECQMLLTRIEEAELMRNPRPIGRRGQRNYVTSLRLPARAFRKLPVAANDSMQLI